MSGTVCLLFLFFYSHDCVDCCFYLPVQHVGSLCCMLICPSLGSSLSSFVLDIIHQEPYHDTFSFSPDKEHTVLAPASIWLCRVIAAARDRWSLLFMDVQNDLLFLTVALCLSVCCHALCYAKVVCKNANVMLSHYKVFFFFSVALIHEFFCIVLKLSMAVTVVVWM